MRCAAKVGIAIFLLVLSCQQIFSQPLYREEILNAAELETLSRALAEAGHKDLIPIRGVMKWSMDDKAPFYYYLTCARTKGGMARVEMTMTNYPIKDMKIKVIK